MPDKVWQAQAKMVCCRKSRAMKYYKTDSRKISFIEYWYIVGTFKGFLLGAFNKIRGKQMNFVKGIPGQVPFREKVIEASAVPRETLGILDTAASELKLLGFHRYWYYSNQNSLTMGSGYAVQALHDDGQALGKIVFVQYKSRQNFSVSFISQLRDTTFYITTNNRRMFNTPPGNEGRRIRGATAAQLWESHQKSLKELADRGNQAKVMSDFEQMAPIEDDLMSRIYADRINRGIWVEMTEAEVNALRTPPPIPG